jgi:hypothetical protein
MFDMKDRKEYLKAYHKTHYQQNKEIINAHHLEYNENNREKNKLRAREWYQNNKEKASINKKAWRDIHPGKMAELTRRWRQNNPDKWSEYSHIYRARKKQTTIEKISIDAIYQRDNWICQICKQAVNKKLKYPHLLSKSLDHIIPLSCGGTHTKENVQLAHFVCNRKAGVGGVKQLLMFG